MLDEADIMLDMGFREEIDEILSFAPENRTIWLFSATVMQGVQKLIKSHMHDVTVVQSTEKGMTSQQVKQYFCVVPERKRIDATSRFIDAAPDFYGIIFCRTKMLSSEVTEELASKGFKVNCLHGDMKQTLRNHVIKGFKNKDFTILVATDVAARGIDVSDLTHVINYSMPDDNETYVHRIGRTGRAGKEGIAILFVSPKEMYRLKRLEQVTKTKLIETAIPPIDAIVNAKMSAVSDFIEQAKLEAKTGPVDTAIKELIRSFGEQEIRDAFVISLRDKFFKGVTESKDTSFSESAFPQEICLELGIEHGLDEERVRGYLYSMCQLSPQEVTKVRVLRTKTFISIPENRLDQCMKVMREMPIVVQKYKVYLVQDTFKGKSEGGRKDRFHQKPRSKGKPNVSRRFESRGGR